MNREDELNDLLDDVKYMITWIVSLDSASYVEKAEVFHVVDMEALKKGSSFEGIDYLPSEEYMQKAIEQFKNMDWSEYKPGTKDIGCTSYQLSSNPNKPICSNDQRR